VLAVLALAAVLFHVPRATLDTGTARVPLAVSSWCAGTKCGAPLGAATRPAVARRGVTVRLVLGFEPRTVSVIVGGASVRARRSGDEVTWPATRGGGITVTATAPSLSVTYVGRLVLR
jgi:hypothetical protein